MKNSIIIKGPFKVLGLWSTRVGSNNPFITWSKSRPNNKKFALKVQLYYCITFNFDWTQHSMYQLQNWITLIMAQLQMLHCECLNQDLVGWIHVSLLPQSLALDSWFWRQY